MYLYRKFFLIVLLLLPLSAFAQQSFDPCSLNPADLARLNMTQSQLANLTADCAGKGRSSGGDSLSSVKAVAEHSSEIGEAAKGIAQAIGIAAKELGIAVNDFLKSPAGTLTVAFIFAKFFGAKILGLLLLPLYTLVARGAWQRAMIYSAEYTYEPVLWGLFKRRRIASIKRTAWRDMGDSQVLLIFGIGIAYCAAMGITVGAMFVN